MFCRLAKLVKNVTNQHILAINTAGLIICEVNLFIKLNLFNVLLFL